MQPHSYIILGGKIQPGNRRFTVRGKGVECESRKNCFHEKCQGITDTEYKNMQEIVLICLYCAGKSTTEDTQELKVFKKCGRHSVQSRGTL